MEDQKPSALTELDPNTVTALDVHVSKTDTEAHNPSLERVLPEGENDGGGPVEDANENAQMGVGTKKKKKRKSKSKRGLNAPTGFEEFYVDAPLTPAEFDEEKGLYDGSIPFAERIETAIQRYAVKRRMDAERKNLFDKYLIHGGVEAGPKMFSGGLDSNTLENCNAAEIRDIAATNFVGAGKGEPGDPTWAVDFEGCVKSFLSSQLTGHLELESEEKTKFYVGTIRNFLNYLLHHDVCPEYRDQINAARKICDTAEKELWAIAQLKPLLPGQFNMACSEMFGGMYQGMYSNDQEWMMGLDVDYQSGISPEQAQNTFETAVEANASDEIFQAYRKQLSNRMYRVTGIENTSVEVTDVILPTELTRHLYAQDQCAGLQTIGKLKAKTWLRPSRGEDDLTAEEEDALVNSSPKIKQYEFWVEEELLEKCFVGLKLDATVTTLSFGVCYFDVLDGVHCSFHQTLPNELMRGWKEPEKGWLPMKRNRHLQAAHDALEK